VLLPALLALATAAAPSTPRAVPALLVDAEFVCSKRTLVPLVLAPDTEGALRVPADCPGAAAQFSLRLGCTGRACTGSVRQGEQVLADVEGTRPRKGRTAPLPLTPRPGLAPETLAGLQQLQLTLTGEQALQVDPRVELERPLRVSFRGQSFAYGRPLEAGARTELEPRQDAPGVRLSVQAERLDAERVRLRLWTGAGARVLERTLRLGEAVAFPCERSGGWCAEPVQVWVERLPPRPLGG
jgi:hypothetical protein